MQAVSTGAYRAVEYIKRTFNLDKAEANTEDSKEVVKICTQYAQKGMWNIFIALICFTLGFAFFDSNFFVAYLISIACFGLFQAIYMRHLFPDRRGPMRKVRYRGFSGSNFRSTILTRFGSRPLFSLFPSKVGAPHNR